MRWNLSRQDARAPRGPNLTLPLGTEVELVAEETMAWIPYREDALIPAERPALLAPVR